MSRKRITNNSNSFDDILNKLKEFLDSNESNQQFIIDMFRRIPHNDAYIPYAAITQIVFSCESLLPEKVNELKSAINDYEEEIKGTDFAKQKRINIRKFVEHIELAIMQKNVLYMEHKKQIENLNQQIAKIQGSIIEFEKTKKDLDEIRKEYNSMTRDFVGIMGISSAIVFAVFGGLQQIGSIGQNLYTTPLHKILIFSGISALILTYVVFMAFNAIARMTGLNLSSCNCDATDCEKRSPIHKHPTLFAMTWMFMTITAMGMLVLIFEKYIDTHENVKWLIVLVILVIIIWSGLKLYREFTPIKNGNSQIERKNTF